jgi:hypothetical protein
MTVFRWLLLYLQQPPLILQTITKLINKSVIMTTNDINMKLNHKMTCRAYINITRIMDKFDIGLILLCKNHIKLIVLRINKWRNERTHGWISKWTWRYIPGTMVSVCVFSHVLKMDDALIGAMSCVSKILSSFVYAFSTTQWQIYLGKQQCMSNKLSTRSQCAKFLKSAKKYYTNR